jgi:hypothetical protein
MNNIWNESNIKLKLLEELYNLWVMSLILYLVLRLYNLLYILSSSSLRKNLAFTLA